MVIEPEFKPILDRKKHKHDFDEHFAEQEGLLKDITNYGSNLIVRCFGTSNRQLEDTIVIGTLLKQVVAMVDGAEILISNVALYSSNLQARAGFEASLYIDWILKNDTEIKAKYYYISNLRKERLWALRMTGTSHDQVKFDQMMRDINSQLEITGDIKDEAQKQIDEIDQFLSRPSFSDINNEIINYKNKKRLDYEPSWYSPLGVSSVRKIAIDVGRLPEYEFIYSLASEVMHSSKYRHHIRIGDGKLYFEPIRNLKDIKTLITLIVACTLRTYMAILKYYRPDELRAFGRKYLDDWRKAFLGIKSVAYSSSSDSIII